MERAIRVGSFFCSLSLPSLADRPLLARCESIEIAVLTRPLSVTSHMVKQMNLMTAIETLMDFAMMCFKMKSSYDPLLILFIVAEYPATPIIVEANSTRTIPKNGLVLKESPPLNRGSGQN